MTDEDFLRARMRRLHAAPAAPDFGAVINARPRRRRVRGGVAALFALIALGVGGSHLLPEGRAPAVQAPARQTAALGLPSTTDWLLDIPHADELSAETTFKAQGENNVE